METEPVPELGSHSGIDIHQDAAINDELLDDSSIENEPK